MGVVTVPPHRGQLSQVSRPWLTSLPLSSHLGVVSDDPFTVTVEAGFDEDGVWVIDARLRSTRPLKEGSALFSRGRLALLETIIREERRGRELGALWVRVHLEAGKVVRDLHLGGSLPDLDSIL